MIATFVKYRNIYIYIYIERERERERERESPLPHYCNYQIINKKSYGLHIIKQRIFEKVWLEKKVLFGGALD